MEIIIQTSEELSAQDRAILKCLLMTEGEAENFLAAETTTEVAEPAAPAPEPAKKRKAAKKAEPEPAPEPEPEEAPAEAEEAPEPEAEEAPEPEAEEAPAKAGKDPMAVAIGKATALVSEGKSSVVKAALADLGVRRVSELDDDNVGDFLKALQEG